MGRRLSCLLLIGCLPLAAQARIADRAPVAGEWQGQTGLAHVELWQNPLPERSADAGFSLAARDDDKEKLKRNKERFESLPPEERERIKRARENYEKMSPDDREALRKKWENMSDEEKRRYKVKKKNRD